MRGECDELILTVPNKHARMRLNRYISKGLNEVKRTIKRTSAVRGECDELRYESEKFRHKGGG